MENNRRLLSIPRFCEELGGISIWTARKWIVDGKLGSVKVGARRMVPYTEVERLIAEGSEPAIERLETKSRRG